MAKGKKTTERFDHRINIRVSAKDWHTIMLQAQKEHLPSSTWIRKKILELFNDA